MSKHYRMKTKDIEEPRYLLSHYRGWVEPHFEQDSLLLTVCLLRTKNPDRLIKAKFEFLDRTVFGRRPERLSRFPIKVLNEGFPHCHAVIANVPYSNPRKGCSSLEDAVRHEFKKTLPRTGDVDVRPIAGGAGIPLLYSLECQGPVEVLVEAIHLPSRS